MPKFTKHVKASRVLGKSASDGKTVRGILKERNQSGSQTQNKDAAERKDEGNGTIEWSDWLWDERSQIYYRAKKDPESKHPILFPSNAVLSSADGDRLEIVALRIC